MSQSDAYLTALSVADTLATWHRICAWSWCPNPQPRQLNRADRRYLIESTNWRNDPDPEAIREAIEQEAREYPLSVCVRCEAWQPIGAKLQPDSWEVLICTGGPTVRIIGALNCADWPVDPVLQCQDWGTPWQHVDCDAKALLWFAELFIYA